MVDEVKIQRILLYEMFSAGQTQLNSFQIDLKNALYIGCGGDGYRVVGHAITRIYTVTYVSGEIAKGFGIERVWKDKAQLVRQYRPPEVDFDPPIVQRIVGRRLPPSRWILVNNISRILGV